jgi:hypothetical protein
MWSATIGQSIECIEGERYEAKVNKHVTETDVRGVETTLVLQIDRELLEVRRRGWEGEAGEG